MINYNGFISDKSSEYYQNQRIEGEIVDLFDQTANIVLNNQFPTLLTIGSSVILGSPNSLSFPMFDQIRPQLQVGDRVELFEGRLFKYPKFHATLQVTLEETLHPPWKIIDTNRLADLKTKVNDWQTDEQPLSAVPFYQLLTKEIVAFQSAFLQDNWQEIQTQIQRILGLGLGLTPSGDDFLTGILLVFCEKTNHTNRWQQIITDEWYRTNRISQHQLYFALSGRGKRSLLQVVQGIGESKGSDADFRQAMAQTFAIGSTSGHDLLWGVLTGFDLWNEKGEERK